MIEKQECYQTPRISTKTTSCVNLDSSLPDNSPCDRLSWPPELGGTECLTGTKMVPSGARRHTFDCDASSYYAIATRLFNQLELERLCFLVLLFTF